MDARELTFKLKALRTCTERLAPPRRSIHVLLETPPAFG
jgi:hypothetical protein